MAFSLKLQKMSEIEELGKNVEKLEVIDSDYEENRAEDDEENAG